MNGKHRKGKLSKVQTQNRQTPANNPTGVPRDLPDLWTLRALDRSAFCLSKLGRGHKIPKSILRLMHSGALCKEPDSSCNRSDCAVRARLAEVEHRQPRRSGLLFNNIERFGELLGLSAVEKDILALAVLAQTERVVTDTLMLLCAGGAKDLVTVIANMTEHDEAQVQEALSQDSILVKTEMISTCVEVDTEELPF